MKRLLTLVLLLGAAPAKAAELNVVSWNTWGLPFPFASEPRKGRFPGINERLEEMGVDIAGLQEVWRGARSLLHLRGLHWPGQGGDSGLALLTEHQASSPRLYPFRSGSGVDKLKKKGVLASQVTVDDEDIWVLVTHMQAGTGKRAQAARRDQIEQLSELVESLEGPTVVMGDFNLYDDLDLDLEAAQRLRDAGLVDAGSHAGPTHTTEPHRLDRIYLRELQATELTVEHPRGLSDHRPVRATLSSPE